MYANLANITRNEINCGIHAHSLKLYSKLDNRIFLRGRCLEHTANGGIAYSGIDERSGDLLYIIEWKISYNNLSSKCSIRCKSGCVNHTPQNIIAGIEEQLNFLKEINHKNLIRYETVTWLEDENFLSFYLVREFIRGSSLRNITESAGWTQSGIRKTIATLFEVVAHLHKNMIPLGNINSTSIFIDESGVCKVADYFLVPYFNYLTDELRVYDNFTPNKEDDLMSLGDLIESFSISSEQITDLIKKCKSKKDLATLMDHPFLMDMSMTRFEADFQVLKHLGAGGFGDVLRVKNYHDEKEYAVKRIRLPKKGSTTHDNAKFEVKHLSILEHINIIRYFSSWSEYLDESAFKMYKSSFNTDGEEDIYDDFMNVDTDIGDQSFSLSQMDLSIQPSRSISNVDRLSNVHVMYILMELCDERNLRKVIDDGEICNDPQRLRKYFREIADGLRYIHSKHIIHGDLKPDNIFLSEAGSSGRIKIGDFGLATTTRLALKQYREKNLKDMSSYNTVGTPLYLSPEVIRTSVRNPKMDMYSFGIILFEMCHQPFTTSMQRIKTLEAIRTKEIIIPTYMNQNVVFSNYKKNVEDLLNHDIRRRPSAKQLLKPFGNYKKDLAFNSQPQ